jgi:ABC-type polysaccharide/polyol phosphate transport system ATPase subunit
MGLNLLMSNEVIRVTDITMKYRLASEKVDSLKYFFIKKMKRELHYEDFYALDHVSFTVNKGEVFGIIGRNGAGKSTLLKIIAGVLKPTTGTVVRNGSLAPLIELGAGFNSELTGKENIFLNGMLLGFSKKFITEKIEEIIEFSELGKFIHSPIKTYSSGMKARLGFSIATIVQPDILIVDEILSVGDTEFRKKSEQKIMSMIQAGTTVLFVSHSLEQMARLSNRLMWLEQGKVREIGSVEEVIGKYKASLKK